MIYCLSFNLKVYLFLFNMGIFARMDKKISAFVQKCICCNQLYSMKHKICEILKYLEISVKKIPCFHLYLFKNNEKNLGHLHFVGFSLYLFPPFFNLSLTDL